MPPPPPISLPQGHAIKRVTARSLPCLSQGGACSSPKAYGWFAAAFFVLFEVLGSLVLLTLFVGVVSMSMEEAKHQLEVRVCNARVWARERAETPNEVWGRELPSCCPTHSHHGVAWFLRLAEPGHQCLLLP